MKAFAPAGPGGDAAGGSGGRTRQPVIGSGCCSRPEASAQSRPAYFILRASPRRSAPRTRRRTPAGKPQDARKTQPPTPITERGLTSRSPHRLDDMASLQFRKGVREAYTDVYTPAALAALEALAPLDGDRKRDGGARRPPPRPRAQPPAHRLSRSRLARSRARPSASQDARAGNFDRQRHPRRPRSASGSRAPGPATRPRANRSRAACATSPTRCSPAPTAGCSTARTRSARSRRCRSTTSATSSSRSTEDPRLPERRRGCRRRDEPVGRRLLRPSDRRRLAAAARLHDQDLPRPRPAPRRSPRAATPTAPASRPRSSTSRSTSSTTTSGCAAPVASVVLYLPKIQTAEEAALWNDILSALESHLGLAVGTIKVYVLVEQVEACLPADGDSRRARPTLRRLQHRTLGLHQQRLRRDGVGLERSSIRTSTPSR